MTRFRLRIEYDGTDFHGFAETDGVRTVAGELRAAIGRATAGAEPEIEGTSRTDTGVHALDQCVLVTVETRLGADELGRALQALTPPDIGIVRCEPAPDGFDPRRDAVEKLYLYRIWNAPRPPVHGRRAIWWVSTPLDTPAMARGGAALLGEHDFSSFRTRSKGEPESAVRTLRAVEVRRDGDEVWVQVIGDGFLYRMVRNIVGTLVDVGRGKLPAAEVAAILVGRDRRLAGASAPPQGLFLVAVAFPGDPPLRIRECPLRT